METRRLLAGIGLNESNCVVIGSGILSALGIRSSNDIDVVVTQAAYDQISASERFVLNETHGRDILADELFEIGTSWGVLGKGQSYDDLASQSVVIDGVRYIDLEFLLRVKESWLHDDDVRQKDIDDVALIKAYLASPRN